MIVHHFRTRSIDNPLNGVVFDDMETAQIRVQANTLMALPTSTLMVIHVALGYHADICEDALVSGQDGDPEAFDVAQGQWATTLLAWAATQQALRNQD